MQPHELRRQLRYNLPVGETLVYNGYEIERVAHGLILHHPGERDRRCPRRGPYERHCEWVMAVVTQATQKEVA